MAGINIILIIRDSIVSRPLQSSIYYITTTETTITSTNIQECFMIVALFFTLETKSRPSNSPNDHHCSFHAFSCQWKQNKLLLLGDYFSWLKKLSYLLLKNKKKKKKKIIFIRGQKALPFSKVSRTEIPYLFFLNCFDVLLKKITYIIYVEKTLANIWNSLIIIYKVQSYLIRN